MALRAASSLMSHTGPGGCSHSRPVTENEDGSTVADDEWVLECGTCEPTLAGHELWGAANAPRPLTVDEMRLRDAQQADATRNVWASLAAMPEALAQLAMQNQATMQILLSALQNGAIPGVPAVPVAEIPAVQAAAAPTVPAAQAPPEPKPAGPAAKKAAAKKTTAPRTTSKAQG
jgi:hypothetical protein